MSASREELVKIAGYLRREPSAVNRTAEEIAAASGVSLEAAKSALRGQSRPETKRGTFNWEGWRTFWSQFGQSLDRLEPHNGWVVFITTSLAFLVIFLTDRPEAQANTRAVGFRTDEAVGAIALVIAVIIHFVLYYRHAKQRLVWRGSLILWGVSMVVFGIAMMSSPPTSVGFALIMSAFAFLILATFYGSVGAACALVGAYVRLRRVEQTRLNRSRQELLARLFEIEEALEKGANREPSRAPLPIWAFLRDHQFALFLPANFVFALLMSAMVASGLNEVRPSPATGGSVASILAISVLGFASMALHLLFSYIGGSVWRSILNALLYSAVGFLANIFLIELNRRGITQFPHIQDLAQVTYSTPQLIVSTVLSLGIGVLGGLASFVLSRSRRERLARENDPETLVAELVEIQRRLAPSETMKCVVVFDAAKSSRMKANADALTAEWSFRAYQEFLRQECEPFGGVVHSTAGDGAIVIFDACEPAFEAARAVQTNIAKFNQNVNRLADPFRLRIGVHCQHVGGDLNEVQFSAVIDVAAHVEAVAQVGGIAVSEPVAEQLPDHRFLPLGQLVDDFPVLIAMQPTLDPE